MFDHYRDRDLCCCFLGPVASTGDRRALEESRVGEKTLQEEVCSLRKELLAMQTSLDSFMQQRISLDTKVDEKVHVSGSQQPHSIVQRRLLEGNIPRLRGETRDIPSHVRSPLADSKEPGEPEERSESTVDDSTEERESPEESEKSLRSDEDGDDEDEGDSSDAGGKTDSKQKEQRKKELKEGERAASLSALVVQCKCGDAEVMLSINTGCQHNHISKTCCRRLGLKTKQEDKGRDKQPVSESSPVETVKSLQLQLGRERVQCTAQVIEDAMFEVCLGLQTLLELKCCVDLKSRVLRLHSPEQELPFLDAPACSQCHHHDNNKNM